MEKNKTPVERVAEIRDWPEAVAMGYMDGARDAQRQIPRQIPPRERTEYAYGYYKGYAERMDP